MPRETYYITCAIPYTNAPAHIGHALEFVMTDVLARYQRTKDNQVLLLHGADEHGTKNYEQASDQGLAPQDFVDKITADFVRVHKDLNISYDNFIRTSSSEHARGAQAFWRQLDKAGDIYKGKYKGLYCVGCEAFVTDNQAKAAGGTCPIHQKPYQELEEENYFFRLSKYTEQIKQAIETDRLKVFPETRRHEILSLLNDGLTDISASRPKSNLPWGVPVPDDDSQVMYVWFEALMNYLTGLGYPKSNFESFWPPNVQVLGKDILRFHAAIWPAMLLSAGLPLPYNLFVHGFITIDGKKMSKTIGNVVDPFEIIEGYGADAFRYYLLRHIPSGEDGDFSWQKFENAYNGELANDLGNLVNRVASMLKRYKEVHIDELEKHKHDEARYHEELANFRFDRALDAVWSQIKGLNQYIDEEKPWQLFGQDNQHLKEVLSYLVGSLLQISDLVEPFLPDTGQRIRQIFQTESTTKEVALLFPKIHNYTAEPVPHDAN